MLGRGELRLTIEGGSTRFPVRVQVGGEPVTAALLSEKLPLLVRELQADLGRAQQREERS